MFQLRGRVVPTFYGANYFTKISTSPVLYSVLSECGCRLKGFYSRFQMTSFMFISSALIASDKINLVIYSTIYKIKLENENEINLSINVWGFMKLKKM